MPPFPTLLLIGAGKMGGAMLEGWLRRGLPPENVVVVDPHPSERIRELSKTGLRVSPPMQGVGAMDVVVLATKPQTMDAAAPALRAALGPKTLLISIVAGKTVADLRGRAPEARAIVRAMPNTPASVGRGVTGCYPSPETSDAQKAAAATLLGSIGRVEWVETEDLIDAVTALSGSGPAYVFHLVEALAAAGKKAGLPPDLAARLARATVEGAGELLYREPEVSAEQLRRNVTSPGGTTAAALDILMADEALETLMTRTVAAAKRRAAELSG